MSGSTLIAETILGADTASIDFSSVANTFRHLVLECLLRSTKAAVNSDSVLIAFNNDTTSANYDRQLLQAASATVTGQEALGDRVIGLVTAATAPANHFATTRIEVVYYAATTAFKTARSQGFAYRDRTTLNLTFRLVAVGWANTAAINQVTLTPGTGNWLAGSAVSLYGVT